MRTWVKEFQEFISRGNVIELAVGLAMGVAFTAIVNSLVNDIIMPIVGMLLGGRDFTSLTFAVGDATFAYGNFIQAVINFLVIALVLFWIIKTMNRFMKKQEAAPPPPTKEEVLLTEIRDLLQARPRI